MGHIRPEYVIVCINDFSAEAALDKLDSRIKGSYFDVEVDIACPHCGEPHEVPDPDVSVRAADLIRKIDGLTNGYVVYFVSWDGSKEGWSNSDAGDTIREKFVSYVQSHFDHPDIIHLQHGGDDATRILFETGG